MSERRRAARKSPRSEPVTLTAAATAAYYEADFERCRALLDVAERTLGGERASADAALLRSRLARAENDAERWYSFAREAAGLHPEASLRTVATALEAGGAKRLGKSSEAARLREQVERAAAKAAPGMGLATYLLGVDALEDGDVDRAERLARRNLNAGQYAGHSRALLGWIEVGRERYPAAIPHFTAALRELRAGEHDGIEESAIVAALALLASELIDLPLGRNVREWYADVPWGSGNRKQRFEALGSLRNLALLEGDLERAWVLSREMLAVARPGSDAAIAEISGAVAARLIGDRVGPRIQLERAWEILRAERWTSADAGVRDALTAFAAEATREFPAEARKAVTLYRTLRAKAAPAGDEDRRVVAVEHASAGRVAEILGKRDEAIRSYREALAQWSELGYLTRAALVALDLLRLTGERAYRKPVERALARAPKAWFARELKERGRSIDRLTPAERIVLAGILEGKTAKGIGSDLDRSHFTVTNHTRKILAAFEVNTRTELLAKCAEQNITPADARARAAERTPARRGR